jgi:DNA polymerase-3 subunit epsilon/ATP-dependent DNA helicase DinG
VTGERLADAVAGVRIAGERLAALGGDEDEVAEHTSALKELIGAQSAITHGIHDPRAAEVVWLEASDDSGAVGLHVAPAHIGAAVRRTLVERHRSVVLTSATLAVAGALGFALERFGVADIADSLRVGSPFDHAAQSVLLVPSDIALPHEAEHAEQVAEAIDDIARALDGRTLALFTSHVALREVAAHLAPLEDAGIAVLVQGVDGSRRALLERFAAGRAVLLGTRSFWEGVDLPGDLLRCVVVARLPFDVPDDPLVEGRAERYDDPFREYQLPQAALRLRQGVGRLIRTKSDRGAIVVLDRRLITRDYGPTLLASLPPAKVQRVPRASLAALVAEHCRA